VDRAVEGEGFVGRLFLPPDSPSGAVLVVPGSTGAAALAPTAALLAAHGYATLVAAYMREEGLPGALEGIPVETLGRAGARLRSEAGTESIGILSASVGTQGALAALALGSAEADCAIAIAPSSVIWQALPGNGGRPPATAAWSHRGEPLPWLPIHGGRLLPEIVRHAVASHFTHHPHPEALHMLAAYEPGLRDSERADRAAIPVERIECPLLVLAGEDDQMWPGAEMARKIATRRKDAGVAGGDIVFRFPDVGHFLRAPIAPTTVPWSESLVSGGDPAANAYAEQESWATMLDFLGNNMRAGPG
jgi:pimeloyl-ACP methyl ester carboxylesterase